MVVEILDPANPWQIYLPVEPDRDRVLVARNAEGHTVQVWLYEYEAWWTDFTVAWKWWAIVQEAMSNEWTLWSLPPDAEPELIS